MGWLLGALLGGYFLFNSQATPDKAAQLAQEALQKRYPDSHVLVEIEGKKGRNVLKGRFKRVRVQINKFTLADLPFVAGPAQHTGSTAELDIELNDVIWNDLPLEEAHFRFKDVSYDLDALKNGGQLKLVKCGPATAHLRLNAIALQHLLDGKIKDVPDPRLLLEENRIRVTGERTVLGAGVPFEMTSQVAGKGADIVLDSPQVKLAGVPLPGVAVDVLLRDINPVYRFDPQRKWPFAVQLKEVRTGDGILDLNADLLFKQQTFQP